MVKNIKRFKREKEREFAKFIDNGLLDVDALDFVPTSYMLPTDYSLFMEEFKKDTNTTWIVKPANRAQGKGIFLVNKLAQMKKWMKQHMKPTTVTNGKPNEKPTPIEPYLISRYISSPLLIGGRKFDLRIYVLVTSFKPLKAYLYREGFARFCTEKYSAASEEISNPLIHLTNVSIQKHAEDYNEIHGGKWSISDLRLYLESTRGYEATSQLFAKMVSVIVATLYAAQASILHDRRAFELYGFDILIDEKLKPWLVEVNASPSLTTTTDEDRRLKTRLINDTLHIVVPPDSQVIGKKGVSWCSAKHVGGFDLIVDEMSIGQFSPASIDKASKSLGSSSSTNMSSSHAGVNNVTTMVNGNLRIVQQSNDDHQHFSAPSRPSSRGNDGSALTRRSSNRRPLSAVSNNLLRK